MTGVDTDLATLREAIEAAIGTDADWWNREYADAAPALARVEAELARLEAELVKRPTLEEAIANVNHWKERATQAEAELDEVGECLRLCTPEAQAEAARLREERDREREAFTYMAVKIREAAEARCARLQQALETIERDFPGDDDNWRWVTTLCREALAGPDTPAVETDARLAAVREECEHDLRVACDCDDETTCFAHRVLAAAGPDTPADSQDTT